MYEVDYNLLEEVFNLLGKANFKTKKLETRTQNVRDKIYSITSSKKIKL